MSKKKLMAQLAYHISTGTALWNYIIRKGTVLYLALEDNYRRLQERLYRMFGSEGAEKICTFLSRRVIWKADWTNSYKLL